MTEELHDRLEEIRRRIEEAALRANRAAGEIKLVAVSKTHPASAVREAILAGVTAFGENKVQEGESKVLDVGRGEAEWHLIGHLQSNKARKAVQTFDVIESVDSMEIAAKLERICEEEERNELPVFVQVDLAGEETKSGITEKDLPELIEYLKSCERLKLRGLMILPPYFEDPEKTRPFFRKLREIRDELAAGGAFGGAEGELSMGMSHDFEVAIEEGATIVRVGTAIFGEREYAAV